MESGSVDNNAMTRLVAEKFPSIQVNFPNPKQLRCSHESDELHPSGQLRGQKDFVHFRAAPFRFSVKNFLTAIEK
jgi:hypothetical protein